MPVPDPYSRTQEQSIKARKHELFEDPTDEHPSLGSAPRRSFAECLRDTPARPLDPSVRIGLWAIGVLVVLLLLAAFAKVGSRPSKHRPTPAALRLLDRSVLPGMA